MGNSKNIWLINKDNLTSLGNIDYIFHRGKAATG